MLAGWLAAALLAFGVAACGSEEYDPKERSKSPHPHFLAGFAYADGPVVGARIRVYSSDGKLLADEPDATEKKGNFYLEERNLPSHYRVVATGGTHNGKPFREELRAEVRDDDGAVIHLSPVSTVTSHHLERNPDATHDEATDEVHDHLAIPAALETRDLRVHDRHFDGGAYLAGARRNGGVAAHAKQVAEAAAGDGPQNPYPERASNQGVETLAFALVDRLVEALLAEYTDQLKDSILGPKKVDTETPRELARIHEQLNKMMGEIADIKVRLDRIETAVAQTNFNTVIQSLPLNKIDYVNEQLALITATTDATARERMSQKVRPYIEAHLQSARFEFERAFLGTGPVKQKLMDAYGEVAKTKSPTFPTFTPADNKLVFSTFALYDLYLVSAVRANVDAEVAVNPNHDAKGDFEQLKATRDKAKATLPSALPATGLVDTRTKLYWRNNPDNCGAFDAPPGAGMTRKPDRLNGKLSTTAPAPAGATNWRMATLGELKTLLKDRGSDNPPTWLRAHGFDKAASELERCGELVFSANAATDQRTVDQFKRDCTIIYGGDAPPVVNSLRVRDGSSACHAVGTKPANALFVREMTLKDERYW